VEESFNGRERAIPSTASVLSIRQFIALTNDAVTQFAVGSGVVAPS